MILVRTVLQARHGAINQLVQTFTQATHDAPERPMILTDLSGRMDTMVLEARYESLGAYEQWRTELFRNDRFQQNQTATDALIESGSVEFYTIEQE